MTAPRTAIWLACAALFGAGSRLGAQADGSRRWAFDMKGYVDSSPAVAADGTIYVGVRVDTTPYSGRVVAVNRDGTQKWVFTAPDWVESSPAISADGKSIYVGCWDGNFYALSADKGVKQWALPTHSLGVFSSPTVGADGTVYVVSGDLLLHAVTADGVERWTHPAGSGSLYDSAVAIGVDGTLYFGVSDQNVYALNPDRTEKWHVSAGAALISSPAIGPDGTIYLGTSDNGLLAISSDGRVKWRFFAGNLVVSSPSIAADGTIYFGSLDGLFYALNADSTLKWKTNIHAQIASTAAVRADGTIIFGADDWRVHTLGSDGTPGWTFPTGDIVESSPVIAADGSIYVGSFDNKLYSLNGTVAPLSTFSSWPMLNRDAAHSGRARAATAGGYLVNLSTLAQAGGGANLIAGFVVQGSATKRFLIRAVGPSLAQFNVPNPLADPAVSLVSAGTEIGANDNWSSTFENSLSVISATQGVTFQLGAGEKDAALVASLAPANYTAVVTAADGGTGVALVEAYDLEVNSAAARLVNLSTRAQSGSGANVLTAGLVIGGQGTLRLLVRAVGPGLTQFGVGGVLAQPTMRVYSSQTVIQSNAGWTSGGLTQDLAVAARLSGAFPLAAGSADCASVLTLTAGNYTIQVSGVGGTTGEALVEVYAVP